MNCLNGFPVPNTVRGLLLAKHNRVNASRRHTRCCTRTLSQIALVDESRDHMAVLQVEVVVGTKDVGWYDAGEHAAILLVVGLVSNVDDTLGVGVTAVGVVWLAVVNLPEKLFGQGGIW